MHRMTTAHCLRGSPRSPSSECFELRLHMGPVQLLFLTLQIHDLMTYN